MTFRIGGGKSESTCAALCTAKDKKELFLARGTNNQVMQKVEWDLNSHVGQKMFIKVVD